MDDRESVRRERAKVSAALFALLTEAGALARGDRLELATALLGGQQVTSFTDLSLAELAQMTDALRAWRTVQTLRLYNGALAAEAKALTEMVEQVQTLAERTPVGSAH